MDYAFTAYKKLFQDFPDGLKEAWGAYRFCHHVYGFENSMQANKFLHIHFQRHPIGKEYPPDVIHVWRKQVQALGNLWEKYDTLPIIDSCLALYEETADIEPVKAGAFYSGAKIYKKHHYFHEIWQFLGVYRFFHTQLNGNDVFVAPIHHVHLEKIAIRKLMDHHFKKYQQLPKIGTLAAWLTQINPLRQAWLKQLANPLAEDGWKSYIVLWLAFQGALIRVANNRPILDEVAKKTTEAMVCLRKCSTGHEIFIVSPHELEMLEKEGFINLEFHSSVVVINDDVENTKLLREVSHKVEKIKKTYKII
jgi:hypothetical protein